jgi:hypothetical protein
MVTFLLSSLFIAGCGDDGDSDKDNGGGSNFAPKIKEIRAYATTMNPGTSTPLKVSADDWDGDLVEYSWEATAGQFDTTAGESVVWTAPDAPTTVQITVSATDGKDTSTDTVSIEVKEAPDIVSTWSLVSVDNASITDYKDEVTLVYVNEDDDEVEFTVNIGYSSQAYA